MATFSRGLYGCGLPPNAFSRTILLQSTISSSLHPFLSVVRSSQTRCLSASPIFLAQPARKEQPSPEVQAELDRLQRKLAGHGRLSRRERQATNASTTTQTQRTLPKVENFDLLKSSEAFYMNSKTGQSSLRDLLPKHDVLSMKPAIAAETAQQKPSPLTSIRDSIPFFGVKSEAAASKSRQFDDAESETIYNVPNSLPTTLTFGATFLMLMVIGSGTLYMLYIADTLTPRAGPGGAPSTNWVMLAEAVGVAFLFCSLVGLNWNRSGLVRRVRFIPLTTNGGAQIKPWLRSKALSKSGLDASRPEGNLEVTYRGFFPFAEQTESFNVREMRVDRNVMTKRHQFEDDYWDVASIRLNERADGSKMGWFRRYLMEMTSIVFGRRTLNMSAPPTEIRKVLGLGMRTWKLDLLGFDGLSEREFTKIVPIVLRR